MSAAKKARKMQLKAADEANLAFMDGNRSPNGQKCVEKKVAITSTTRTRAAASMAREIEDGVLARNSVRQTGSSRGHLKPPVTKEKVAEGKELESTRNISKPATTSNHRHSRVSRKREKTSDSTHMPPKSSATHSASASNPPKSLGSLKGTKADELTRSIPKSMRTVTESKPLQNRGSCKEKQMLKPTSSSLKEARAALPATTIKSLPSSHLGQVLEEDQPECSHKTERPKPLQRKKTPEHKLVTPPQRKAAPQENDGELSEDYSDIENLDAQDHRSANDHIADEQVIQSDDECNSQKDFSPVEDDSDFRPSGDEFETAPEDYVVPEEFLPDDELNPMEEEEVPAAPGSSGPNDGIVPKPKSTQNSTEPTIEELKLRIEKLEHDLQRYITMNFILQEELHAKKDTEIKFTHVRGYFKPQWLLMISQRARDSDYVFVKQLVVALFPNGVGNATVSGGPSPNPSGSRPNAQPNAQPNPVQGDPVKIDPGKVAYIRDRLYERRRLLSDDPLQAADAAKFAGRHITRVLANNPRLKQLGE